MNLRLLKLIALMSAATVAHSRAQDPSDIPPPKPPFVSAVPDAADWTITVKAPASMSTNAHTAAYITEVHSVQTGPVRRDEISYSDGAKTSHWFTEKFLLWKTQQGEVMANDLRTAPVTDREDASPSIPQGFPGVAWLQATYYEKAVTIGQRRCYHFVHDSTEAWIDVDTHLPVAYKISGSTFSYKFGDPPAAPLQLPAEYQKTFDQVKDLMKREEILRKRPVANR